MPEPFTSGLKFRITAQELGKHCTTRAEYHTSRAKDKEKELPSLVEALEKVAHIPTSSVAETVTGNALSWLNETTGGAIVGSAGQYAFNLRPKEIVQSLKADIQRHRDKAASFRFAASHLFDNDYALDTAELIRLEMLKE